MSLRTTLLSAVAVVGLTTAATAAPIVGQISIGGFAQAVGSSGMGSATGLSFANSSGTVTGTSGAISNYGGATGTFAGMFCATGSCGTIQNIASFTTSPPITNFLSLNSGVSFDLSSITGTTRTMDGTGGSLVLTASGTIKYAGFDNTAGIFTLTAQGNAITSFSATTLASAVSVPEPASLAILGGSMAALGLLRRKKA